MGQAKQRGSREERIAQAKARPKEEVRTRPSSQAELKETLAKARRLDPLINGLTTPDVLDDQVTQFAQQLTGNSPMFLDCQPEPWSRQSCCDLNVAKYIERQGGRMLCGYRIWYTHPRYIEGERHAVWTDGEIIRDVSFVDTGETRVAFVPDDLGFDDAPGKVRYAFGEDDKEALAAYERLMEKIPITKMPDKEAWDTYLTYEDWLAGNRMSNLMINTRT